MTPDTNVYLHNNVVLIHITIYFIPTLFSE